MPEKTLPTIECAVRAGGPAYEPAAVVTHQVGREKLTWRRVLRRAYAAEAARPASARDIVESAPMELREPS